MYILYTKHIMLSLTLNKSMEAIILNQNKFVEQYTHFIIG